MIKIQHPSLEDIKNDYSDKVVDEILNRIGILEHTYSLLISKNKIIKERFYETNKAIEILFNDKKLKADNADNLIKTLENNRKKTTLYKARLEDVNKDITYLKNKVLLKELISSPPNKLTSLQLRIEKVLKCGKDDLLIKHLFSYDDFYEVYIKKIGAALGINVCPYCNRQYITDVVKINKDRIIGPTYDHFFHQAKNPLLTLSFYNLIPSCSTCNSNLKHEKQFKLDTHLHPYVDEMGNDATFDFELDISVPLDKAKIDFKPKIVVNALVGSTEFRKLEKTVEEHSGSLNVFKLKEIYATHNDIVEEIYDKFDKNNPYYVKSIEAELNELHSTDNEFYRFHFGNYFNPNDFHKRPLAKLSRDIYNKMKAISLLKIV